MNHLTPLLTSLFVFVGVFLMSLLAMRLRSHLPEHHLSAESKDTVKLTMGLVGAMTALVLGLLVASAKGNYDAQRTNIITASAQLIAMDRTLAHYGTEAALAREALRQAAESVRNNVWPTNRHEIELAPNAAGDRVFEEIQLLKPSNEAQASLKVLAMNLSAQIGVDRWLLFERSSSSISTPLLTVVACWIAIMFCSFGLFAPSNLTVITAFLVAAICVSGAIFMVLELDHPFDGLIRIPRQPLELAISNLGK